MSLWRDPLSNALRHWGLRRTPPVAARTITHKTLYILPTAAGWAFIGLALVLLVLGINYQNNLIYACSFMLISLALVSMLHTYANLVGVRVGPCHSQPVFAGQAGYFTVSLCPRAGRVQSDLQISFEGRAGQTLQLEEQRTIPCNLAFVPPRRGRHVMPVILLESRYPLGLLRAWSWVQLEGDMLAYPRPVAVDHPEGRLGEGVEGGEANARDGVNDFAGLRLYQPGEPVQRIVWKSLAAGRGLHAKQFVDYPDQQTWLSLDDWPNAGLETRLSYLSYWIERLHREGQQYGLRLGSQVFEPACGAAHRQALLSALACYGEGRL